MSQKSSGVGHGTRARLLSISAPCSKAQPVRSVCQLSATFCLWLASYAAGLALAKWSLFGSAVAAVVAAAFVVRLFMIQHDCGHRSFFRSRRVNDTVGFWLGVLTMTPYRCWRRFHAQHHSSSGNLDQRSIAGSRAGIMTFRRLEQTRSDTSQSAPRASRTAGPYRTLSRRSGGGTGGLDNKRMQCLR